jgi:hypothetical protein
MDMTSTPGTNRVRIEFGQGLALVWGHGTRELLTGLAGRTPLREEGRHAWVTTPAHALSLAALLVASAADLGADLLPGARRNPRREAEA